MKISYKRFILGTALFICLCVGLPLYFCGCDSTLQKSCSRYWIHETVVYDYKITQHTCQTCLAYATSCSSINGRLMCTTYCTAYSYYTCYNSYALEHLTTSISNTQCIMLSIENSTDRNGTLQHAKSEYPINSHHFRYIDKLTDDCSTSSKVRTLAIVGFVFLCLAMIVVISWSIMEIIMYVSGGHNNHRVHKVLSVATEPTEHESAPPPANNVDASCTIPTTVTTII